MTYQCHFIPPNTRPPGPDEGRLNKKIELMLETQQLQITGSEVRTLNYIQHKPCWYFNKREMGVQEAIYRALPHLPLTWFSPEVIVIPSDLPSERHGVVKPKSELSMIVDLEDVCYAELFAQYKVFYGNPSAAQKPKLINLQNGLGRTIKREKNFDEEIPWVSS